MPSIANLATSTSRLLEKIYRAVCERFWVLVVTVLFICLPVYAMAWPLNVFDNIASSITVTVAVSIFPVMQLSSPPEQFTKNSYVGWFSVFTLVALALFIGDEYDLRFVSFSVFLVLIALPYGWVFWQILRHEWLLSVGFALALAATMIYWIAGLAKNEEPFDFLLLPLPVILAGGVFWAPIAWWTLKKARQNRNRRISGPGMQVMAMTMLFFPIALVAIVLPTDLGLSSTWSNVSLALIGIFLSGVISEPLRCFLLEWGNLKPKTNLSN